MEHLLKKMAKEVYYQLDNIFRGSHICSIHKSLRKITRSFLDFGLSFSLGVIICADQLRRDDSFGKCNLESAQELKYQIFSFCLCNDCKRERATQMIQSPEGHSRHWISWKTSFSMEMRIPTVLDAPEAIGNTQISLSWGTAIRSKPWPSKSGSRPFAIDTVRRRSSASSCSVVLTLQLRALIRIPCSAQSSHGQLIFKGQVKKPMFTKG